MSVESVDQQFRAISAYDYRQYRYNKNVDARDSVNGTANLNGGDRGQNVKSAETCPQDKKDLAEDVKDTPMGSPSQGNGFCTKKTSTISKPNNDSTIVVGEAGGDANSNARDAVTQNQSPEHTTGIIKNGAVQDQANLVDQDVRRVLPREYEKCKSQDLGVLIADMLAEMMEINDAEPLDESKLTRFHSRAPPGISCHDYMKRLIQHATLLPAILLAMVFFIDRLCALYPAFTVNSLTVHRFLITAATVASKGLSDAFWTNSTYARIGGISTTELATLELDFLQRISFRILPTTELLEEYYIHLVENSRTFRFEHNSQKDNHENNMVAL